jgi:hypothetical protein
MDYDSAERNDMLINDLNDKIADLTKQRDVLVKALRACVNLFERDARERIALAALALVPAAATEGGK